MDSFKFDQVVRYKKGDKNLRGIDNLPRDAAKYELVEEEEVHLVRIKDSMRFYDPDVARQKVKLLHKNHGHMKARKLWETSKEQLLWIPESQCKEIVAKCRSDACKKARKTKPQTKVLRPLPVEDQVFHRIQIDLQDWRNEPSSEGSMLGPALKSKNAEDVGNFIKNWIDEYGQPAIYQTDNGKEFKNKDMSLFLKELNIKEIHSRAHHPQSQGKIERLNRTLKDKLWICMAENFVGDFETELQKATRFYNNQVHSSTGTTPFKCLFSVPKNLGNFTTVEASEIVESVRVSLERTERVRNHAKQVMERANHLMVKNNILPIPTFLENDVVKVFVPRHLKTNFRTPSYIEARVFKVGSNHNYRVMFKDGSLSKIMFGPSDMLPGEEEDWSDMWKTLGEAGYSKIGLKDAARMYRI